MASTANVFARMFYEELSSGMTPAHAAAVARKAMLTMHLESPDYRPVREWHLARLYVNAAGGELLLSLALPDLKDLKRDRGAHARLD